MSGRIETISLDCFRGASGPLELTFDSGKAFTLIFGENGTGKSTIADAIDFVANQSFGSLKDRSLGTVRHPFVTTLNRQAKDCKVTVVAGTNKWSASLKKAEVSVTGVPPALRAMVLRRAQLLNLVETEPAKRYEALQQFIDVEPVEDAEQQLRDAIRNSQTTLDHVVVSVTENETGLNLLWEKEGKPKKSAIEWAASKVSVSVSELEARFKDATECIRLLDDMTATNGTRDVSEVALLAQTAELEKFTQQIANLSTTGGDLASLAALLTDAQAIVKVDQRSSTCPLCEQPVDVGTLIQSIQSRLAALQETTTLLKQQRGAVVQQQSALTTFNRASVSYEASVRKAAKRIRETDGKTSGVTTDQFAPYAVFCDESDCHLDAATATALEKLLLGTRAAFESIVSSAQASLATHNAISGHLQRLAENTKAATSLHDLLARMKSVLEIVEATRKAFAQAILDEVSTEASRTYALLHPNESIGELKLVMSDKKNKKGSIEQEATFNGTSGVQPQAYFSESHLDTLGFCVWLAVAKRTDPKSVVIVLDDVFTSVDSVHLTRIMSLLNDIAGEFAQLVVLTHYRTWRDRYRLNQGPGANVQLLELHRWTLARGVKLSGTVTGIEELEATLAVEPVSRQAIASQAGILLEAILDRLTLQFRRRLPRNRDSEWTLGDLFASCKKLLGVIKLERTDATNATSTSSISITDIQPYLDDTGPFLFIRNQVGCHFNPIGSDVADNDVETFGKAAVALARALSCHKCGDIPDKRDGTHFRCGCKKTKMTPLEYDK